MKYRKHYLVIIVTVFAIIIDLIGRVASTKYNLPMWLDSFGTIFIAYVYGPVCGGIVGLVNNIIYGIFVDQQSIYCIVGVVLGILTGILAKKGAFRSLFDVMTLGAILSFVCTMMAVPLNILLYDGAVGNVWADQTIIFCMNYDVPKLLACIIAQFYIEFLDKFLCSLVIFLMIKTVRFCRNKKNNVTKDKKIEKSIISIIVISIILSCFCSINVVAANDEENDNDDYKYYSADYDTYTHTSYGTDEGLLAGEANDIAQTKEGQLWIGTYAGLYSYDGINFDLYNNIDSIKNVNDLYVDEEGRLWVGTNDNGLTMMINGRVMNVLDVDEGLLSNSVKSIVCDSNGNYYVGSASGVSIVTLSGGVHVVKSFDEVKNTIKLDANSEGDVIAVTDSGDVYFFHDGEIVDKSFSDLEDCSVTSVFFDSDDKLYFALDNNTVIIYSDASGNHRERKYKCIGLDTIKSFYEMENGELFVCSDSGVGYFNNAKEFKLVNTDRFTSSIDNMLVDYQGDLWFSSSRLGLLKLCKSSFTGLFTEISEEGHVVNAVSNYDGMLFCGTDDGLIIIDESNKTKITNELTDLLENIRIRHINVDSSNNLWISTTGGGLFKITAKDEGYNIECYTDTNGMPGKRVRCSIERSNGDIVAVGDDGVAFINDQVKSVITAENGLSNVKSLCVIEYKGNIYVGSDGGGITVINGYTIVDRITKSEGLSSDVILRMIYDEYSDGIFIVTSNGLCYLSSDGTVSKLDGFPYSNNFDIIPGKNGNMWVLSSAGVYLSSSDHLIDNEQRDYELLNSRRGLRSSITANSYSYVDGGYIYLCCDDDVVKVRIDDYNYSAQSYRMILNSVNVDGFDYEISRNQPLNIKADANEITFDPIILNYSLNDPYIRYCLIGSGTEEKTVLLSELGKITYTNIKPGKYTFKISVLDSSKENVIESGNYVIIKDVEMYQQWWFKLYIVFVAALIIIWMTWYVTRTSVQKTVREQQLELEYAKKQLEMGNATILSIARTVDAKDPNTSEHSFRVSEYSVAIARRYGFDADQCETIRQMALLHDIGKIGIPDSILNKPGKLDADEYDIMKSHVTRGGDILKDFTLIENVSIGALYHHERYDGKGYCSGLKGEDIPIEARIIGLADAFDAMTANRVYRKKLDIEFVLAELERCKGAQFDPELTDILLKLIEEKEIDIEMLYKESKENM